MQHYVRQVMHEKSQVEDILLLFHAIVVHCVHF